VQAWQTQSFQSLELSFVPSFGPWLAPLAQGVSVFPVLAVRRSQFVTWVTACLDYPTKGLNHCRKCFPGHRVRKAPAAWILRTASILSIILFLSLVSTPAHAQMPQSLEYRTKANFLSKFPSFIDWPDTAFPSAQAPFLFCIFGEFSFGPALAEITRATIVHGRQIEVRSVRLDQDLRACQVLFISRSKRKQYERLLEVVQGSNVLAVGETPDFINAGGALSLSFDLETLHFEVNLVAANVAHLKISSRMLALARRVINNPEAARS
jgi:hypothetical protein